MSQTYTKGPYTLRQLASDEWRLLKTIRLEALATSPAVFGNSLAMEMAFPDEAWQERLNPAINAVWGLFYDEALIGLTSVFGNAAVPTEAKFTTSFIRPAHRGKGLAAVFHQTRLAWAKARGLKRIIVTHRDGNEASKNAIQRAGFSYTHQEPRLWPDGQTSDNVFYELLL